MDSFASNLPLMQDADLAGKRVLIREDFNVPMEGGEIRSDARMRAALPTLRASLDAGAGVLVMSHLGRPKEGATGQERARFSLAPVARHLGFLLGCEVPLVEDWSGGVKVEPGTLALLENVRFLPGECANDPALSARMAALCDVYVMDAFAAAHRAHASTCGVAEYASQSCAGPLLAAELEALGQALSEPARPVVAVVGGAKVSTKIRVLAFLAEKVDQLVVGGGIANTFLLAAGFLVGRSLCEPDLAGQARSILERVEIPLPKDVLTAADAGAKSAALLRPVTEVAETESIFDIGPASAAQLAEIVRSAGTVIWNGPVGMFEDPRFEAGTAALAQAIADCPGYTLAGGGDTLAAVEKFGVAEKISYLSTGGGAFLECLEGRTLPAVAALQGGARK